MIHTRVGEEGGGFEYVGEGLQIVAGSRAMASSISSHSLHFSGTLPHTTVPTFLAALKKRAWEVLPVVCQPEFMSGVANTE